jgi:aminoglycoside phosphotransferase (APT) family kinase protein
VLHLAVFKLKRFWRWFLAYYRLNLTAVCEMSAGRALHADFHDWKDSALGHPWHMTTHYCKRCGKAFTI